MSFSIFGLTFYFYGLIIAVAIFIAVYLIEIKSKKLDISEKYFWNLVFWILLGGVIGARVWHLITDFHLYVDNFWGIFKIWDGGLSILGAIFGGVLSLRLVSRGSRIKHVLSLSNVSGMTLWVVLDLAIFGLPFGQAIGRLANYFNQELYGWPTNLPWAIYINPENRALRFKEFGYYHPLFAYEALATFSFGLVVWRLEKSKKYKIGSGKYFSAYLIYYGIIRFLLDFLRIDKQMFINTNLGINQLILLLVLVVSSSLWFYKNQTKEV